MVLVSHPPMPFAPPAEPYSIYAPYAPLPTRSWIPSSPPTPAQDAEPEGRGATPAVLSSNIRPQQPVRS